MSILIIGSNSFSGASLASHLLTLGENVVGVSRSSQKKNVFLPYRWEEKPGDFVFEQVDLNSDLSSLRTILQKYKPTVVFNFAAQSMVAESWVKPWEWYQTNVTSLSCLAEILANCDFLEKYVHFSTPEVYGSTTGVVQESFVFNPSTPYATSRAAGDWHLMNLFEQDAFPVIFTRASNVFGPGQQLYRLIPRIVHSVITGEKFFLDGGGLSVRSFIHSSDVSKSLKLISDRGILGETYHISTQEFLTVKEVVERVCWLTDSSFEDLIEIRAERPGKDMFYRLATDRLDELGWVPEIELTSGLRDVVSWYQKYEEYFRYSDLSYQHKA